MASVSPRKSGLRPIFKISVRVRLSIDERNLNTSFRIFLVQVLTRLGNLRLLKNGTKTVILCESEPFSEQTLNHLRRDSCDLAQKWFFNSLLLYSLPIQENVRPVLA